MFSSVYPHHRSWIIAIIWGWMNGLALKTKVLRSIWFFFFIPLEEEKRILYHVFQVFCGRLRKSRSPSSWPFYEREFVWCAELREAAFPTVFNPSLIPGMWMWRRKWQCSLVVPQPLHRCVFTSASSKALQTGLQNPAGESHLPTWYWPTSANALFPRNLWKEKSLIVWLKWSILR